MQAGPASRRGRRASRSALLAAQRGGMRGNGGRQVVPGRVPEGDHCGLGDLYDLLVTGGSGHGLADLGEVVDLLKRRSSSVVADLSELAEVFRKPSLATVIALTGSRPAGSGPDEAAGHGVVNFNRQRPGWEPGDRAGPLNGLHPLRGAEPGESRCGVTSGFCRRDDVRDRPAHRPHRGRLIPRTHASTMCPIGVNAP